MDHHPRGAECVLVVIALGNQLGRAIMSRPHDRAEGLCTAPDGLKRIVQLALGQLHDRQRTQIKIALRGKKGPRVARRHFTIADIQQPVPTETVLHAPNARHIERVIGTFP
jgi:hypothetical protein